MPAFANPFDGNVSKVMDRQELIQALRIDLASELEAAFLYDAHIASTTDEVVKATLTDIRNEEVKHAGQLYALLRYLDPEMDKQSQDGEDEFHQALLKLGLSTSDLGSEKVERLLRGMASGKNTRTEKALTEARSLL